MVEGRFMRGIKWFVDGLWWLLTVNPFMLYGLFLAWVGLGFLLFDQRLWLVLWLVFNPFTVRTLWSLWRQRDMLETQYIFLQSYFRSRREAKKKDKKGVGKK
jgi:hypothetical protein